MEEQKTNWQAPATETKPATLKAHRSPNLSAIDIFYVIVAAIKTCFPNQVAIKFWVLLVTYAGYLVLSVMFAGIRQGYREKREEKRKEAEEIESAKTILDTQFPNIPKGNK